MQTGILLFFYFILRAFFVQGGLFLFIKKSSFALRQRIYKIPYSKGQIRSELMSAAMIIILDSILVSIMIHFHLFKDSKGSLALAFLINFVWFEIWFYVSHRILHMKAFYFLHKQHHVAKVTSPFTALSFSFAERFILLSGSLGFFALLSHFVELPFLAVPLYLLMNYLLNLSGHSNIEFVPSRVLNSPWGRILNAPSYHALHHARYQGHYGLFTPYLDQLLGTYFLDYRIVQEKASNGEGLNSLGQRFKI